MRRIALLEIIYWLSLVCKPRKFNFVSCFHVLIKVCGRAPVRHFLQPVVVHYFGLHFAFVLWHVSFSVRLPCCTLGFLGRVCVLKTFALTVPTLSYVAALWVCQQRSLSLSTVGEANRCTLNHLLAFFGM